MTDHRAWAKMLAEKALARFGARVWFMGLQGSVRRGAATESSDIDFVLILDRLDTADLSAYRELVRSMPDSEKACGFVSGRKELLAWPRADLFQFYHDTEALYGSLSEVGALLCPRDARAALHMGAANVYHAACHSFLFEDVSANLPALYKAAFFVLQTQAFAASGVYCEDAAALERHLPAGPCWRGAGKRHSRRRRRRSIMRCWCAGPGRFCADSERIESPAASRRPTRKAVRRIRRRAIRTQYKHRGNSVFERRGQQSCPRRSAVMQKRQCQTRDSPYRALQQYPAARRRGSRSRPPAQHSGNISRNVRQLQSCQ